MDSIGKPMHESEMQSRVKTPLDHAELKGACFAILRYSPKRLVIIQRQRHNAFSWRIASRPIKRLYVAERILRYLNECLEETDKAPLIALEWAEYELDLPERI